MKIKTKMNKWDLIKIKTTCTAKETINKMKRQPTEWKKIFLNNMIGKGVICKIYNSSYNSTSETHTHLILKEAEDLNRHFSNEDIQMANKFMKRHPASLIIREMQFKTTVRNHLTPARMAIIKKNTNNKCL